VIPKAGGPDTEGSPCQPHKTHPHTLARTSLGDAVVTYLDDIRKTKKHKTYAAYRTALEYFLESCTKARVTDIVRSDLIQYSAFLRDTKKLQPRTG
jgi:hypothetical protein